MPTPDEIKLIGKLGDCYSAFTLLPQEHDMAHVEFCQMIHRLQDMVAARATYRECRDMIDAA